MKEKEAGPASVAEYLKALPEPRQKQLGKVRALIKKHLPKGYVETLQYGMISYVVPLSVYPRGYLGRRTEPLPYLSLASQKSYMSVYLMNVYGDPSSERWFKQAWQKSGKKLDMGKSCLRFKDADDLALDVLAEAVARTPVSEWIAIAEKAQAKRK